MKKLKHFRVFLIFIGICAISLLPAYAQAVNPLDASSSGAPIQIDGYFDDWNDKPFVWEFNWPNNPIDGEDGFTTNSRHKISLYRDEQNVYLHIIMAKYTFHSLNGNDYEFTCDGQYTQFRITTLGDKNISQNSLGAGINPVNVRYADGRLSGTVADGSEGMLLRHDDGYNDELEIKIPIGDFHIENSSISPDNIKEISFFTPNLMMQGDKVTCAGTSTGPILGISICLASVTAGSYIIYRKRKKDHADSHLRSLPASLDLSSKRT